MPLKVSPTQVAFNARGDGDFKLPFEEQIKFFRQKTNLPTEHYDDILHAAHDRAFMVAGATKADLLVDLRDAVDKAIADGQSIQWFRKEFSKIVQKHGWDYTGAFDWRTRVIYSANIRSSYAAGRYAQLMDPELLKSRPFWKYNHNDSVAHPRPRHVSWNGTVLRYDNPWWQTHFTPNGWECHCYITAVPASEFNGDPAPDDGTYEKLDRYGVTHMMPNGVDYGWGYTPGAGVDLPLRSAIQDKLIRYPAAITRALTKDANRYINASETASKFAARVLTDKQAKEPCWLGFVENPETLNTVVDADMTGYLVLLPSDAVHHIDNHHQFDGQGQRPAVAGDYDNVWRVLAEGSIKSADASKITGAQRFMAKLNIDANVFRCVFEVSGKKLRAVSLITMSIQTD